MIADDRTNSKRRRQWSAALAKYTDQHTVPMLALGFASGLPYMLLFSTLSVWLTEAGVTLTNIGLASFVGFPLTLNFLWAPLVDRISLPVLGRLLGRRRGWILFCQLFIVGGILAMAVIDPAKDLFGILIAATVVSVALATQGVAIDAWRIEAAGSDDRQAALAAPMLLGARVALLLSGAGALYIAAFISWPAAYAVMAALMVVGIFGTLFASPLTDGAAKREPRATHGRNLGHALYFATISPFVDFFSRHGWTAVLILATIGCYRLPDFLLTVMSNPFYLSVGFSKVEIASISQIIGISAMIAGTVAGGLVFVRIGVVRSLLLGVVLLSITHFAYAWLAVVGHNLTAMTVTVSLENFVAGFGGTALIAYMSSLTSKAFTATQYALLTSFIALPGHLIAGFSGYMVGALGGFYWFFIFASAMGIPSVVLTSMLIRTTRRQIVATAQIEPVIPMA